MGAANLPLVCTGPISYRGQDAIQADIANFTAALAGANLSSGAGNLDTVNTGSGGVGQQQFNRFHKLSMLPCKAVSLPDSNLRTPLRRPGRSRRVGAGNRWRRRAAA